jgi:hypothetical protein
MLMNHGCADTCCSPNNYKSLVLLRYIETAMHNDLARYKGTRGVEEEGSYVLFPPSIFTMLGKAPWHQNSGALAN